MTWQSSMPFKAVLMVAAAGVHQVGAHRRVRARVRADDRDPRAPPARPRCLHGDGRLPATRQHADSYAVACQERGRGNQAQHAGARPHRGDVQVGRAPDAAVHIIPVPGSAPGGQPGHRTRGSHRVGDISLRCARRPEHHPVPGVGGHRHHPQAAIEPRRRAHAGHQGVSGPAAAAREGRPAQPPGPAARPAARHPPPAANCQAEPGPAAQTPRGRTHRGWQCLLDQAGCLLRPPRWPGLTQAWQRRSSPQRCRRNARSAGSRSRPAARRRPGSLTATLPQAFRPTPKTSTSGGFTHNECRSAVRRPPDEVASVHAP